MSKEIKNKNKKYKKLRNRNFTRKTLLLLFNQSVHSSWVSG